MIFIDSYHIVKGLQFSLKELAEKIIGKMQVIRCRFITHGFYLSLSSW